MIELNLAFWEAGPTLTALQNTCTKWWARVETWVRLPIALQDAETCPVRVLDLIAWQRDITRFPGEAEALYRLRVKHAYANAKDAGSKRGFEQIFQRLGMGELQQLERQENRDWDWITLQLDEQQLADYPELVEIVVQQYGRTCRRYEFLTQCQASILPLLSAFDEDHQTVAAILPSATAVWAVRADVFTHEQETVTAAQQPDTAHWLNTIEVFANDQQTALATLGER